MVRLTKIYTRGGDKGQTSLGDGSRVSKNALRVAAYGTIDEANAIIGVARVYVDEPHADAMLGRIQNDLFDVGADLCRPAKEGEAEGEALRVAQHQVDRLEHEIDTLNRDLKPLDSFILPGGSAASAHLHHARTVVRRAERLMAELAATEAVNAVALAYVNRLSDHLFVLARHLNVAQGGDVLWVPGANREDGG